MFSRVLIFNSLESCLVWPQVLSLSFSFPRSILISVPKKQNRLSCYFTRIYYLIEVCDLQEGTMGGIYCGWKAETHSASCPGIHYIFLTPSKVRSETRSLWRLLSLQQWWQYKHKIHPTPPHSPHDFSFLYGICSKPGLCPPAFSLIFALTGQHVSVLTYGESQAFSSCRLKAWLSWMRHWNCTAVDLWKTGCKTIQGNFSCQWISLTSSNKPFSKNSCEQTYSFSQSVWLEPLKH